MRAADLSWLLYWQPDDGGTGFSFAADRSEGAAFGEAIERYCGNFVPNDQRLVSRNDLRSHGIEHFAPRYFMKSQGLDRRFIPLDDDDVIHWTATSNLATNEECYAPSALIYLNYYRSYNQMKRHFPVLLPGIAAGQDTSQAIAAAVLEIIERDATSLWWNGHRQHTWVHVDADMNPELSDQGEPGEFEHFPILLHTSDAGVPLYTVAYGLHDKRNSFFQVGFATRSSLLEALQKAASEAWQLRRINIAITDKDSWAWKKSSTHDQKGHFPLLEVGDDRNDFIQNVDLTEMTQLIHNLQYYMADHSISAAISRMRSFSSTVNLAEYEPLGYASSEIDYTKLSESEGLRFFYADVTSPDISASSNVKVVRVISPEACPNMPTAFIPLGNERLTNEALNNGLDSPDMTPLPHS